MTAKRIGIAVLLLTAVSLACGNTPLAPATAKQAPEAQSNPPSARQPAAQEEGSTSGFPGCESLPGDIPFLEDAFEADDYMNWCTYKTHQDYRSAVDFYRAQLPANGWNEFRMTESEQKNSSQTHFYYEKSGRKVAVGILASEGYDLIVTIYPDHWIDQPCSDEDIPTPDDVSIIGNMIELCREEYPWSENGEGWYLYEYTTLESFDDVVQFYRDETAKAGWLYEDEIAQGDLIEMYFNKPGRTGTVQSGMGNFIQAPLDHMSIQVMKFEPYGDTNVKIAIEGAE